MAHHVFHRANFLDESGAWSDAFNFAWDPADLALANDDPVASWVDLIAGKSLAQAVGASQPLFKTSLLGYPAVKCDGSNDHLWSSDAALQLSGAAASVSGALLFVLSGGGNVSGEPGGWGNSTTTARSLTHRYASATQYSAAYGSSGSAGLLAAAGGTYVVGEINLMMITASSGVLKIWRNGTLLTSVAIAGDWASNRFALGGRLRATFVVPTTAAFHGVGLAFGAEAAALHADPSAMFALASTKWGL